MDAAIPIDTSAPAAIVSRAGIRCARLSARPPSPACLDAAGNDCLVLQGAPHALDQRAQLRRLRAAENTNPRDRALALTGFCAGLRIGESVALDTTDLRLSARKGHLTVRYGKGGRYREIPLLPVLRNALDTWPAERRTWSNPDQRALFLGRGGQGLTVRAVHDILTTIANAAGIPAGRDADFTPTSSATPPAPP